jgi:hypothetical protein
MQKLLLLLILIPFSIVLCSQELIRHEKGFYSSEDGKLYVQKSVPLYLWMTNTPNKNDKPTLLNSKATEQYANPLYLANEGLNLLRSPSAVDTSTLEVIHPHIPIIFEVYADSKAPLTKYVAKESKAHWNGKKLFYGGNLVVFLNASQGLSGLNKTYYSVNGEDYKVFTDSLYFNEEGEYRIKYYSVDNVGNMESVKSRYFIIDLEKPNTTKTIKGDLYENVLSSRSSIYLKAKDTISGVSKIYYSIDNKTEQVYRYKINGSSLSEGEHVIKYYAIDLVGNKEVEQEYSFYIDKSAPILVEERMGNSFMANGKEYSSGRTKLKLTAVDNKSGIKGIYYSLNGAKFEKYEKPFYLSDVSGSITIVSYSIDKVNNKSSVSEKSTKNKSSYIDLTGPSLKYDFKGPLFRTRDSIYISKETKIFLKGYDKESGMDKITYNLDANREVDFNDSFSIESRGKHTINYTGFDNVGNTNISSFDLIVDNKGPDIFSRFSILPIGKDSVGGKEIDIYSSHVVLFLSATDERVPIDRIYYREDSLDYKLYTGLVSEFKRGKHYKLDIKASDKLGNSTFDVVEFLIDNTGPEIFVNYSMFPVSQEEIDGEIIDVYPVQISLFISVTNAFVAYDKIYYTINNGQKRLYNGIIEGFRADSDVLMDIKAIDKLGNETDKQIHFKIEK